MERPANQAPASGPTVPKRRALTPAEAALIDRLLLEGKTAPQVADEVGRSWSVVGRRLKKLGLSRPMGPPPKYEIAGRTCLRCGKPRVFKHPSDRGNRKDGLCRECYEAGAVVNTCPVCGAERHRPASHAHKVCCGYRHSAAWRWRRGIGLRHFVERWNGAARRLWKLRWTRSPGRSRNDQRLDYEDALEKIRDAYHGNEFPSERELKRITGESRRMIRTALGRPL
jgi:hypothetical protein